MSAIFEDDVQETPSDSQSLPSDSEASSSEIVETPYISRDEGLSTEELVNRVILQLQYNEDMQAQRDSEIQATLDSILSSVSENDISETVPDHTEEESLSSDGVPETVSDNDIRSIVHDVSALVSETVSQNDILNMDIMHKDMKDYNTSESLLLCIFILFFGIFVIKLFKE